MLRLQTAAASTALCMRECEVDIVHICVLDQKDYYVMLSTTCQQQLSLLFVTLFITNITLKWSQ